MKKGREKRRAGQMNINNGADVRRNNELLSSLRCCCEKVLLGCPDEMEWKNRPQ